MANNPPQPPSLDRVPSYLQYTPRRAIVSFENLVALANYEEHLRDARKMVWRDRGEPAVELHDLAECADHGVRGGLRAGAIALTIRSGVNLVLLLVRIRGIKRQHRLALIRRALFGEDSFRAGAMLACFVSLYRIILNALPIIFPTNIPIHVRIRQLFDAILAGRPARPIHDAESALADDADIDAPLTVPRPSKHERVRSARLSVSAQAHQTWVHKRTRRWHALLAGAAAGGCAVMCEKHARRVIIAQQVFVRGLQGSWNAFSDRKGIRVPYGDVLVFSLACAQIMYGYLIRPETLPRSYIKWIDTASRLPPETVAMNRDLVLTGKFNIRDLETIIETPYITSRNASELAIKHMLASSSPPIWGYPNAPCIAAHPGIEHCLHVPLDRFWSVFRWMYPIYGALHLVPTLLFKPKVAMREPGRMLLRAMWGTTRSSAFLGLFVVIYQGYFCGKVNLARYIADMRAPAWLLAVVRALPTYYLGGFLSGLSLALEAPRRRPELAMYVLPKGLESAWRMARGRGLVPRRTRGYGEAVLAAVGMGMVMSAYQNEPEHLSGLVRRILYQFIGPN
ncbi:hypothetical protein K488DRAFT_45628 [Vararia minispora EC-137]|uniref:Uncharacterized protein n=1 Tax=Vararia minispora EC-137 TaxID=1314806 RepID=A0ACB8QRQ2_9AGAM|nr:hypothetical protein K488DRAFT_45628 [Vararia minispora EC-137]